MALRTRWRSKRFSRSDPPSVRPGCATPFASIGPSIMRTPTVCHSTMHIDGRRGGVDLACRPRRLLHRGREKTTTGKMK